VNGVKDLFTRGRYATHRSWLWRNWFQDDVARNLKMLSCVLVLCNLLDNYLDGADASMIIFSGIAGNCPRIQFTSMLFIEVWGSEENRNWNEDASSLGAKASAVRTTVRKKNMERKDIHPGIRQTTTLLLSSNQEERLSVWSSVGIQGCGFQGTSSAYGACLLREKMRHVSPLV
jgi:hypothetical protein